jgi:hypothetical protein
MFVANGLVMKFAFPKVEAQPWMAPLPLFTSGIILWLWGRKLNKSLDSIENLQLEQFGEVIDQQLHFRHSLYEVRMEYWGALFAVLGLLLIVGHTA